MSQNPFMWSLTIDIIMIDRPKCKLKYKNIRHKNQKCDPSHITQICFINEASQLCKNNQKSDPHKWHKDDLCRLKYKNIRHKS